MKQLRRNEFIDDCEDSLRSLSARFGLKLISTRIDKWYAVAEFVNATTGVIFRYESRDSLVQVEVSKLQAGKIVPMPPIIREDTELTTLPLCDVLVSLGASDEACLAGSSKATIRERIDQQVSAIASSLTSILEGDFSSFDAARIRFRNRLNARRGSLTTGAKDALLAQFPQLGKFLK